MRFSILFTLLLLLKLPTNLFSQVAESYITEYIQNTIFTEQYEELEKFAELEWYEKNYDLENSRHIHNLSILTIAMDTIQYPSNSNEKKIYVKAVISSEYEHNIIDGVEIRQLLKPGYVTRWLELGCHWGGYVNWDKELIMEVQQKLKNEKWYSGSISGELNKQTFLAFRFYNALRLNHKSQNQYDLIYPNEMVDRSSIYNFLRLNKHAPAFPSYILDLKKALLEKGYDPGELNNILDDKTKAALIKFQNDQGLPSGALNISTLRRLGVKGF